MDLVALFYAITLIPFADDYVLHKLFFDLFDNHDRQFVNISKTNIVLKTQIDESRILFEKYRFLENTSVLNDKLEHSFRKHVLNSAVDLKRY